MVVTGTHTAVKMYSDFSALKGARVVGVDTMQSEVERQIGQYLLLTLESAQGEQFRVILAAKEVVRPCPDDLQMFDHAEFFSVPEIKARRMGRALVLRKFGDDKT